MALFMIDCDAVSSAISSFDSLKEQISRVGDAVAGYDTSNSEGFNFDGAKSAIKANIEACAIKISNTSNLINNVVESHNMLQGSLNFEASDVKGSSGGGKTKTSGTTSSGGSYSGGGSTGGGASYSGGGSSSYAASAGTAMGGSTGGGSGTVPSAATAALAGTVGSVTGAAGDVMLDGNSSEDGIPRLAGHDELDSISDTDTESLHKELIDEKKRKNSSANSTVSDDDYNWNYGNIKHGKPMEPISSIDCIDSNEIINNSNNEYIKRVEYNENGYAVVDDKYVISCDESLGEVGDGITIVKKDGTKVNCIIGNTTTSEDGKNSINFVVDNNSFDVDNVNNVSNDLFDNTSKILVEVNANPADKSPITPEKLNSLDENENMFEVIE